MRLLAALALSCLAVPASAERSCKSDAMIVFDGSGSMAEMGFNQIDEPRIFDARRAMAKVIPQVATTRRLGLLVYGPNGADECSGIDLRFLPREDAAGPVLGAVNVLEPAGGTPMTEAVERAAEALSTDGGEVVLVTDGKETCGGVTCRLATDLSGSSVTVHVIGFRVRGEHFAWGSQGVTDYTDSDTGARCLAEATGGEYVRAETLDDLVAALRITLGCNVMM
ncbi:MAG: VWA domain-containing protein [Pseudomonadota bacterium]